MSTNSISSCQTPQCQPSQAVQVSKQPAADAARKQSDVEQAAKVTEHKNNEQRRVHEQQAQNTVKPSVNTSGQRTGGLINVAA